MTVIGYSQVNQIHLLPHDVELTHIWRNEHPLRQQIVLRISHSGFRPLMRYS